jgi:C_GCAxxG_C_C family probable redox protein
MCNSEKCKTAIHAFHNGRNCAQSVVSAFTDNEDMLRASAGFGGGIAMTGNICGAVNGGVMVVSLLNPQSLSNRTDLYNKVSLLTLEFEKKFGSLRCDTIQKDKGEPHVINSLGDDEKFCDRFVYWVVDFINKKLY